MLEIFCTTLLDAEQTIDSGEMSVDREEKKKKDIYPHRIINICIEVTDRKHLSFFFEIYFTLTELIFDGTYNFCLFSLLI